MRANVTLEYRLERIPNEQQEVKVLALSDLQLAFIVVAIGYVLGTILLCRELYLFGRKQNNKGKKIYDHTFQGNFVCLSLFRLK